MTSIGIRGLTKSYSGSDRPAVDGVDIDIESGELVSLLGPSGCGKSTTLLMLAGIYRPDSGSVAFDGEDVTYVPAKERGIGMVFQNYALYPSMTVLENIMFPLKHQGVPKAERRERSAEAAGLVELGELLDRLPVQLSGGQQQRVALARALVKRPRILLLDEPMSNLDPRLRLEMRSEVRRLQQEFAITTVLVTHDQDEALSVSDRIGVMSDGLIQQVGTPYQLYNRPERRFVARFLGTPPINDLPARVDEKEGGIRLEDGTTLTLTDPERDAVLSLGDGSQVRLGVRPHQIEVDKKLDATGAEFLLEGEVMVVENAGYQLIAHVDTEAGVMLGMAKVATRLSAGEPVVLAVHGPFHIFDESGRRINAPQMASDALAQ